MPASQDFTAESKHRQMALGERFSLWISRGEVRELTVEILNDLQITDVHKRLAELDHHIEVSTWSLRRLRGRALSAAYPWIALTPLALSIALQSWLTIKHTSASRRARTPLLLPAPHAAGPHLDVMLECTAEAPEGRR